MTVLGFASFFLKARPGNGAQSVLVGEFLYQVVAGVGGGAANGPVTFSLRLVPNS